MYPKIHEKIHELEALLADASNASNDELVKHSLERAHDTLVHYVAEWVRTAEANKIKNYISPPLPDAELEDIVASEKEIEQSEALVFDTADEFINHLHQKRKEFLKKREVKSPK